MATTIVSQSVRSAVNPNTDPSISRQSVYEIITNQILAELEKGKKPLAEMLKTLDASDISAEKLEKASQ